MKNYLLLALFALGASAQVAAYYDRYGNWHRDGLFGWRERRAERRGNYYGDDYYRRGVVSDAAYTTENVAGDAVEGAHEIGHDAHVAASNIFHDIVG